MWTESYPPLKSSDNTNRKWLAQVMDYWRSQTILDADHRSMRSLLGNGGGTPLVNGASQTGSSLITDGWSNNTLVLRAGDIFKVAGSNLVYDVTADATTNASGQVTLSINPPIFSGGSPADNAALTINTTPGTVTFRVRIVDVESPSAGADEYYLGLRVTLREMP